MSNTLPLRSPAGAVSGERNAQIDRLAWRCRRGLLELDLWLGGFFTACRATLQPDEMDAFERMLACSDMQIMDILHGITQAEDGDVGTLVERIQNYRAPLTETPAMSKTVTLTFSDGSPSIELPVLDGTYGKPVIDLRTLGGHGYFSHDPGFTATSSCTSAITYIDGEAGLLYHRGYPIEELAYQSDFMEVSYLLLHGELPDMQQKAAFEQSITHHSMLHDQMNNVFRGFRRDAHPMAVMIGVTGAMSAFYHGDMNIFDPGQREIVAHRLIAKIPTVAAWSYKYNEGQPFTYPQNHLSYAENFMHMMFSTPCETYEPNPVLARALDRIFILHADHEQNASTSTVRLAGSSGANPYACIAGGMASLWGPLHGGANEAVLQMLAEMGDISRIPEYIKRAKDKSDPFRLMGFGHRVYKSMDPRARIIRETCYQVLDELDLRDDPQFKIAMELERIALEDDYFISKKLYPNVDFYSGIIFRAMGIPTSMFTAMFALARTAGWIAQWNEMLSDPAHKIGRPRQLYIGAQRREFVPIHQRGASAVT